VAALAAPPSATSATAAAAVSPAACLNRFIICFFLFLSETIQFPYQAGSRTCRGTDFWAACPRRLAPSRVV
jgi:hypothetical protein